MAINTKSAHKPSVDHHPMEQKSPCGQSATNHEGTMTTITVIGAGNLGHAVAGFLGMSGHTIRLWNRNAPDEVQRWLLPVSQHGEIELQGAIQGTGTIKLTTTDLAEAVIGAELIIICTVGNALGHIAQGLAPLLEPSQNILLLSPGTLGALEVARKIALNVGPDVLVAETSTTPFGCRAAHDGKVTISSRKKKVSVSCLPGNSIDAILNQVPELNLSAVHSILSTGFDNVGFSLHVVPMVFNAARIENDEKFRFYIDGATPSVAAVIEQLDRERLETAEAFGIQASSTVDYLVGSLGAPAGNLHTAIQGTAAYEGVIAPTSLTHRFLVEDSQTGLVPLLTLGEIAGVQMPVAASLLHLANSLLRPQSSNASDSRSRTNLGLDAMNQQGLGELVTDSSALRNWRNSQD